MRRGTVESLPVANTEKTVIWFIRHAQSEWNAFRRIQGQANPGLSELGERQAAALAPRLAGVPFDILYASDLKRTVRTAQLALPGQDLTLDVRLRELHAGALEGRIVTEMTPAETDIYRALAEGDQYVRAEGGESYLDLDARLRSWLADVPTGARVACITHGGVVRTAVRMALGYGPDDTKSARFEFSNTGITELHLQGRRWSVQRVNDHAHLEALRKAPASDVAPSASAAEAQPA